MIISVNSSKHNNNNNNNDNNNSNNNGSTTKNTKVIYICPRAAVDARAARSVWLGHPRATNV